MSGPFRATNLDGSPELQRSAMACDIRSTAWSERSCPRKTMRTLSKWTSWIALRSCRVQCWWSAGVAHDRVAATPGDTGGTTGFCAGPIGQTNQPRTPLGGERHPRTGTFAASAG